jgi:16S rRNA (guanine527-N7)-methyltransferase
MILPELFDLWQETLQWQPDRAIQARFQQLYDLILEGNQRFNLTRITQPEEFWEKHLWDSLAGIFKMPIETEKNYAIIDIGTGAGFPGIPAAIIQPEWIVYLLDSTQKKINFLNNLIEELALKNTKTLLDRAEILGKNKGYKESYNLALVRAVAKADICAEYSLPLLKLGGMAVLYRGNWSEEENDSLTQVVDKLGGKIEKIECFYTPITQSIRHCIYLKKVRKALINREIKMGKNRII